MSHIQQLDFVAGLKNAHSQYFTGKKILEIGSLNINGSVRPFFTGCEYLGIDVGPGRDVDLVCKGEDYDAPDASFAVTISCECFEHNPKWVETFHNMIRMTKPNGLVIMTCATAGRPEHGTARTSPADSPLTIGLGWNYYLNLTAEDFFAHFDMNNLFEKFDFIHNISSHDLYFYGVKK
jgi:SAM-dependent methyltransferase